MSWAILRQLVIGTPDALGDGAAAGATLRLPDGFADPLLADIGLHDYVMPVGGQKYLEYVGPTDDASYINRWLARAGSGGYCLSIQVPDAPACKERALAAGVRLAADQVLMGHPLFQMHPSDVGILLELDGVSDPDVWFWDDVTPGPSETALIDDIAGVRIGVPDPVATAALWSAIIGLELVTPTTLDLSGCTVEFTPHGVGRLLGADLVLADGRSAPPVTELSGLDVTFRTRTLER
jgi:hypothetical protein